MLSIWERMKLVPGNLEHSSPLLLVPILARISVGPTQTPLGGGVSFVFLALVAR